jgi:hypothetical protein
MSISVVKASDLPEAAGGRSIFFTGSTGFIGGTVLTKLLALPTPPKSISLLIRDPAKAELIKSIPTSGTQLLPVVGSLGDLQLVEDSVAEVDVVVSTANADDLEGMQAMLRGMKRRKEKMGHRTILVHTSGTGVLVDDAKGQYPGNKVSSGVILRRDTHFEQIYTDLNPTPATDRSPELLSIATLDPKAPHREVDLEIEKADSEGICKSYVILPSTIWGEGEGAVFDAGYSNPFSQQIPDLIRAGLDRGQAGMVGKGQSGCTSWNTADTSQGQTSGHT